MSVEEEDEEDVAESNRSVDVPETTYLLATSLLADSLPSCPGDELTR